MTDPDAAPSAVAAPLSINGSLAGKRLFITGATGFLGTALVERLLRSVPDCEIALLVRPGRMRTVDQRARREIFRNDCFDRARDEVGGAKAFDELVARRVQVVAGDVGSDGLGLDDRGRELLASCDIVVHSAATVSFDAPLDSAIEVNLLGPTRIAQTLHDLAVAPHLIAVSTCYVAGNRRGAAPEAMVNASPFWVDLDWRKEVDAARRVRADREAASRTPDKLKEFMAEARRELGAAGAPLLADKSEQLRTAWVRAEMVEAGRVRAASVGWPDAYAYTKALGEVALAENRGDIPVSTVRPSIIESSWAEPRPGWIRGFRMAEPVIVSYARGLLKEFPGIPEGVVDVIPVDLVVAAIIGVAAKGPEPQLPHPSIYQVASGTANPLGYQRLFDLVRNWFTENPVYDSNGQPIVVGEWSFPGRGQVQAQLQRGHDLMERAEKLLHALPLRGRQAEWSARIEERKDLAARALAYVELYGAYTECEALYGVDRLLGLWDQLPADDQAAFCFDPRVIDWDHYAREIHLPSVVEHSRVRTTAHRAKGESRPERLRRQVLSPERHLAAFDLENTLIASNVVTSYAWLASRHLDPGDKRTFAAKLIADAPGLLKLDRRDRSDFLRHFYRRYEDAPVDQLAVDSVELFNQLILTKAFPAGIRRVREHRALGHRTVLITGALDFVVAPLRPLFDDIVCARMSTEERDGVERYTGRVTDAPPTGESRAQVLFDYADAEGLSLREAVAYADSASDLPMLDAVGFPVAVNPETRLSAIARKRGWLVEQWSRTPGGPAPALPLARRGEHEADDFLSRLTAAIGTPLLEKAAGHTRRTARAARSGGGSARTSAAGRRARGAS